MRRVSNKKQNLHKLCEFIGLPSPRSPEQSSQTHQGKGHRRGPLR